MEPAIRTDLAAAAKDLAALEAEVARVERVAAVGSPDAFNAVVLRDEAGAAIDVAPLHRAWTQHVSWSWANGLIPVILAPWGHGKTVVLVIGRILWEIGRRPTLRVKLVCNDDTTAKDRVRLIARYIASDDYRAIFPAARPADRSGRGANEPWSAHAIQVEVPDAARAIDPTVSAHGVLATGIGGRCDLLVGDDVVDYRNAVANPAMRPVVREAWERVWESRRESDGRSLYIGTPWHQHDLTAALQTRPGSAVLRAAVDDQVAGLDVSMRVIGRDPPADYPAPSAAAVGSDQTLRWRLPLWERRWPRKALVEERAAKPRAFRLGRQLQVYEDGELTFPSWRKCITTATAADLAARAEFSVSGVDLSGPGRRGTAIGTVGLDDAGHRLLLDMRLGRWTSPQTAEVMASIEDRSHPAAWLVEAVAYQRALVEWIQAASDRYTFAPKVRPFITGANKIDPDVGLPAMEAEFAGGQWEIPGAEFKGHLAGCECAWCELDREMTTHPQAETFDCGMALWFCAHYLRTGRSVGISHLAKLNEAAREANADALREDRAWAF